MEEDIKKCLAVLNKGGVILYPTDTVWGIGCDATNVESVKKISKLKNRLAKSSYLVLVDDIETITHYVEELYMISVDLIKSYDKPLTIIYPNARHLAKNVMAEDGSIGIRVVKNEFCKQLIKKFGKPIVSTSANISGEKTPLSFSQIDPLITEKMDYIVTHSRNVINRFKPSTIIKLTARDEFVIIRE